MDHHTRASILSIGDELILGQKLDSNTRWLSARLTDLGIRVVEHATIDDDLDLIAGAMRRQSEFSDLIVSTGGLGPTADDLTRPALASLLGEDLVLDEDSLRALEERFRSRGRSISSGQRDQATRPVSARHLANPNGTAPGLSATFEGTDIYCLPGPPREMHPMFESLVSPGLRPPADRVIRTRVLHTIGLGEGDAADRLGDLMARDRQPTVGTTASGGVVSVRIRYEGAPSGAEVAMAGAETSVREALDAYIFGAEEETLESVVLDRLRARGEMLVTAESCTGGRLGEMLTEIPGSSDAYAGGWITYTNAMKTSEVGVPAEALDAHGAVSEPVARAMAEGALHKNPAASHALALTGIAGPGGATPDKPVGTVWIARASRGAATDARCYRVTGDRHDVRDRSAKIALAMLRFHLDGIEPGKLLWQVAP